MEKTKEDKDEIVAPEGGWGYMIGVGMSILFIVITGPMVTFGVIFYDFFDSNGYGTSGLTLVHGIQNAVISFTGFLTTSALKRYSLRRLGLIGAFVYNLGSALTIFSSTVPHLVCAYGVLQGIGFGMMIPVILTSINDYFIVKRVAVLGLSSVFVGLGVMFYPTVTEYLLNTYGFKGTLIMICGFNLHTILAMVVLDPVEWHLPKKSKERNFYGEVTLSIEKSIKDIEHKEPLLIQNLVQDFHQIKMLEKSDGMFDHYYNGPSNLAKAGSLTSLGNWNSTVISSAIIPDKNEISQTLKEIFDFTIWKQPFYFNLCIGLTFAFFSDVTFFAMQPMLLYHYGFTETEVTMCLTACAAADLIFRIIITVYTFYYTVNSRMVFFIGACCITFLRIFFMQYQDFVSVLIITGFLGLFRSWLHVFLPLAISENVSKELFPPAYGWFMLFSGFATLVLSVFVGFLRDYTDSYIIAFHFLTGTCLVTIVLWATEFYYKFRCRTK